MSESKHTPGPWEAIPVGPAEGWGVVAVNPIIDSSITGMSEANARLIAAAPDLLEALTAFAQMWGSRDAHSTSKRSQARRADLWDKVNSALAKAEGRS